ncbi:MAG: DUF4234 domain-containing protein [Oribacterium sp.]|nr:DUF4234 domain-containing protein [Oribacterium sp.]
MFCTNCGTEVKDGSKFCPVCGTDLQAQANAQGTVDTVAEEAAAVVQEAAGVVDTAAQTVSQNVAETVESAAAAVDETAENVAVAVGDTAEAVTGTAEKIAEAAGNAADEATDGVDVDEAVYAAGAEAGATVAANAVSDAAETAVNQTSDAVSASDSAENVTAQYAKRIQLKKAEYSGTYSGNQSVQNGQYGAEQGQFNSQNRQYGAGQGQFNSQNGQYGAGQGQFNGQNGQYGAEQGRFSGQTAQFTSQHGQFNQGQPNNGFNGAPYGNQQFNTSMPQQKDGIVTAGMVLCIIALILSFFQVFHVLGGFFGIFGGISEEGFFGFIFGAISFVIHVIKLCGLLGSALIMYLVWKKWDDSKAEPLMTGALAGGLVVILTVILRAVFAAIFNGVIFGYNYSSMFSGAFLSVVFAIAMMAATYVLINEKKINPLGGLQGGNLGEALKSDLKSVCDMAVEAKDEFQTGKTGSANTQYAGAYNNVNQNGNPVNGQPQPNNFSGGMLSTDRSIVAYVLLGLVTCGIYDLYMLHCIIQDVNITCAGDGKRTAGILEYILFGILTCGIYDYIWLYNLGNRLQNNAPRYGMNFQEGGATILLWWVFGALLCGVGPFISANIIIKNSNALNAAYNNMAAQQNGNF